MTDRLSRLRRLRWGIRAALALGVAASIAANILHAQPDVVARAISARSPVALLITIELVTRVPVHHRALALGGRAATGAVAAVAAYVSYGHMTSVAARYGESAVSARLLPLSVDGLVVVASIALLEVGGQIRTILGDGPAPTDEHRVVAALGGLVDDALDTIALRELRQGHGLTREQLAAAAGLSAGTVTGPHGDGLRCNSSACRDPA